MVFLSVQFRVRLRYIKAAHNDALSNLPKDLQECAFDVTLKVALEVALKGALELPLYCTSWCTH